MKKLPKKLLTPTARAGSQSGRGTSSVVPTPSPQSGEGQIPAGEQWLDSNGVGKRLKLSPRTVSEMANDGRLPAYRIGIYLRFKWADVDQFITANCKVAAPPAIRAGLAIDSKTFSTPHPRRCEGNQCAAPHPAGGHLLPRAEKDNLPVRGGEGMNLGRGQ